MPRPLCVLLCLLLPLGAQDLQFAADRPLDLLHVRLDATVDLKEKTLTGKAQLDLAALRPVRAIRLDAVGLEIRGVEVRRGEKALAATHAVDGTSLAIELAEDLPRGEPVRVTVAYTCRDPELGLAFFGPTEEEPAVPYQVWSQGETIETRYWIPVIDHPNERTTTELVITAAQGLEVLSNGRRVSVTENGDGTATWHWRQDQTHVPYLITLVVGDFAIVEETWRGKTVDYWVPPGREEDARRAFGNTTRMLDFFSDRIGVPYPWDKYTQVVVEQFRYGGMENTSATTLTDRTLHDQRAALDYSSDGLVAHELAHQWFGDLLTCRDWAHTWLNEGFATYFEALWDEHDRGDDEFLANMRRKMDGALSADRLPVVHRAYGHPWEQFDGRAYPKGAWILHMIRRRVGDEMWWRAIRHYVEKHQHQGVETVDLRKALEETTGESFERFFHDWTARAGHPLVDVRHGWDAESRLAELHVRQTQKTEAFHFPLRVEYRVANLPRPFVVTHAVREKDQRFFVALPARPGLVRVDPDFAVLMQLTEHKGRDQWLRQLTEDPSPVLRMRAAAHFGKSRRDEDRRALADALGRESFWAVQGEIAKALGASGGGVSRDVLLQALSLEHPKARREVVNALAKFKGDETVRGALEGIVVNGDASYYVEADAIGAWAAMRPERGVERLRPLLGRDSHNEVIREAALKGLGEQHDPAATDLLLAWTARGKPRACRVAALEGLAKLAGAARWDETHTARVAEAAARCLGAREHRHVKTQAADLLRALGEQASPALGALEALETHDPNPDVRTKAKETIDRIRSGAPPQVELERLREELRKLREANERMRERIERIDSKASAPAGG